MAKTLSVKINAPEILEKQLKKRVKKKEYGVIAISTSTEPYQRIEEELKLTRRLLEVISKYRFPVHILPKSTLVLRDLDLLKEIDKNAILPKDLENKLHQGVIINFSFSTLDEKLAKTLEPAAPIPEERLKTMQRCKEEGFLTGVSFIPVLPYLSDSEEKVDEMIKTAREYKADFVFVGALTLFGNKPSDCKTLYYKFLEKQYMKYQKDLEEKTKRMCEKYKIGHRIV